MQCPNWVDPKKTYKNRPMIQKSGVRAWWLFDDEEPPTEYERCGGDLTVEANLSIDGGCSCCGYPEIDLIFRCSRCGEFFGDFLTGYNQLEFVNQQVTNAVRNIPMAEALATMRKRRAGEISRFE